MSQTGASYQYTSNLGVFSMQENLPDFGPLLHTVVAYDYISNMGLLYSEIIYTMVKRAGLLCWQTHLVINRYVKLVLLGPSFAN